MTAELATAFPVDGGAVAWVRASFGPTVGLHHAVWVWLTSLLDAAVYPQLAALYLSRFFGGATWVSEHGVVLAFVLFVGGMNLCGLDMVAASQTVAFLVAVFPCLAFTALGLPRLRLPPLLSLAGPVDGALLLSWSLWLYSGFASLGSVAGEVAQPRRTYPAVLGILLPLVTMLDLLFFMVAISLDPDAPHYTAGYFGVLAGQISGEWLQTAFTVGARAFTANTSRRSQHKSSQVAAPVADAAAVRRGPGAQADGRLSRGCSSQPCSRRVHRSSSQSAHPFLRPRPPA
jgi:amino acid transporter